MKSLEICQNHCSYYHELMRRGYIWKPEVGCIYNMLDGRMDTFWLLDTAPGTQHTIVIQFPSSIRPFVNALTLIPFPAFGFSLVSILVHKTTGSVNIIPQTIESANVGVVDMHFAPTAWGNQVTITLTALGNTIGISNLDLFLIDYVDAYANIVYEVPAFAESAFTDIKEIDMMDFGLYGLIEESAGTYNKYSQLTVTAYTGTTFAGATPTVISEATLRGSEPTTLAVAKTVSNKLYVKFQFKKYNGQSPIFRSVKITHQ